MFEKSRYFCRFTSDRQKAPPPPPIITAPCMKTPLSVFFIHFSVDAMTELEVLVPVLVLTLVKGAVFKKTHVNRTRGGPRLAFVCPVWRLGDVRLERRDAVRAFCVDGF